MTRTKSRSRVTAAQKARAKRPLVQKPPKEELPYEIIEVTDPKKLPKQSIIVAENWQNRVDYWDGKLRNRGSKIRKPLRLYVFTRIVKTTELYLETEPVGEER